MFTTNPNGMPVTCASPLGLFDGSQGSIRIRSRRVGARGRDPEVLKRFRCFFKFRLIANDPPRHPTTDRR